MFPCLHEFVQFIEATAHEVVQFDVKPDEFAQFLGALWGRRSPQRVVVPVDRHN